MLKTYECPICGQYDVSMNIKDPELTTCINKIEIENANSWGWTEKQVCGKPVKRVFKTMHYQWKTDGFCGRGFD